MAVQGEQYFFMMMHMHFLCLMAAKKALHLPLRPGKTLLACLFASLYSLLSLVPALPLQSALLTLSSMVMTAVIAFGKNGFAACLPMGIAGLFFAGVCHFLSSRSLPPLLCLGGCTLLCLVYRPGAPRQHTTLHILYQGKACRLPAFYDTGNHLRHPVLSLPVIVAPESRLSPLLPEGFRAADIATLPSGFTLLAVSTVNGKSLLMAFHPDEIQLENGKCIDALIAVTSRPLPQALLPHNLQLKEARIPWKRKRYSGKRYPPSVNG
ncbi:MAG: sigma-E processing peptidase SpoIIGA [Clostridia bacterium]|nr:sigma-E processing peptidase SpoIIGA [Clostridia bacterium]